MLRYSLRQLEYFVATADHSSVADAARRLNVSQPSVSKAITKMEDQFSVQLFIRHHARGVSLTPAGERLLVDARGLLRYANDLQQNVQESSDVVSGSLELACFVAVAPVFMPAILADFSQQYPGVEVRLYEGNQDEMTAGLTRGEFELAVMYDSLLPPEIYTTELAMFEPYVLLPKGHRLSRQKDVSLASLCEENFILLDVPPSRGYFLNMFRQYGLEPKVAFSSPSLEMVRGLVGRNRGYSLLVTRPYYDQTYDGQTIVALPIRDEVPNGMLEIARLEQIRPTRVMKVFTEFCADWFARHQLNSGAIKAARIPETALSSGEDIDVPAVETQFQFSWKKNAPDKR
ncbi:MAG: LysR family transcriptional regulator [Rhodobacteraceae bacterium]|nr:LysR family transcriptional regulator [Paracoccaceae bacterium]